MKSHQSMSKSVAVYAASALIAGLAAVWTCPAQAKPTFTKTERPVVPAPQAEVGGEARNPVDYKKDNN